MNDPILLAGCVILDDYSRILLLHRNTDKFQHWELPGGKVEEDEAPAVAAARELAEELGVQVEVTAALGNEIFSDANGDFRYFWFAATIVGGEPAVQETDKFDDVDYFDFDDLPSLGLSANMVVLQDKLLSGELEI